MRSGHKPGQRPVPKSLAPKVSIDVQIEVGSTVYLDSNPIIYLTEGNARFKASITALFTQLHLAHARLITSELAYTETLVHPLRNADHDLVAAYDRLFSTLIAPQPISREVLLMAAQLRAQTSKLRTPDAIHIATAQLAKAQAFVTADAGITALPTGMQLVRV